MTRQEISRKGFWILLNLIVGVAKIRFIRSFMPGLTLRNQLRISLVTKSDDTKLMMIPAIRVIAKPFTGPVPKLKRTTPVITVVRFESKITEKARW